VCECVRVDVRGRRRLPSIVARTRVFRQCSSVVGVDRGAVRCECTPESSSTSSSSSSSSSSFSDSRRGALGDQRLGSELRKRSPSEADRENGGQRHPGPPHHRERRQHLRRGTCVYRTRRVSPLVTNRNRRGAAGREPADRSIALVFDFVRLFIHATHATYLPPLCAAAPFSSPLALPVGYLADFSCVHAATRVPSDRRLVLGKPVAPTASEIDSKFKRPGP